MADFARFRARHDAAAAPAPGSPSTILHVDMDAFFVSVELLERPELRGKPVVVGGQPNQRGVVTAASYEARKFGIQSAMPLRTAGKLCPHAIFLDGHHPKYTVWSRRVAAILAEFSPLVQQVSIDEACLDLSGTERLHGPPLAAAHKLLRTITARTGLPCSAGLAATRLVAKVASDQAKPRGLLWVPGGCEAQFLAPLEVRKIPGVGAVTERALRALGIETVAQLAATSEEKLRKVFGEWASPLAKKSRGLDSYEFVSGADAKSISHDQTLSEDSDDGQVLSSVLSHLSQKACKRLRDSGLAARTVTLTIRYAGFDTHTRSRTFPEPVCLDAEIFPVIQALYAQHRNRQRKVRLLGVSFSGLVHPADEQLDLLDPERRAKLEKLTLATDRLRDRFGFTKIRFGGALGDDKPH